MPWCRIRETPTNRCGYNSRMLCAVTGLCAPPPPAAAPAPLSYSSSPKSVWRVNALTEPIHSRCNPPCRGNAAASTGMSVSASREGDCDPMLGRVAVQLATAASCKTSAADCGCVCRRQGGRTAAFLVTLGSASRLRFLAWASAGPLGAPSAAAAFMRVVSPPLRRLRGSVWSPCEPSRLSLATPSRRRPAGIPEVRKAPLLDEPLSLLLLLLLLSVSSEVADEAP